MVSNLLKILRFSRLSNIQVNAAIKKAAVRFLSSDTQTVGNDEYVEVAEYPPIEDLTYRVRRRKKLDVIHNEIRDCRTVEEKQIKINMPRYYGFKVSILDNERFPYNCLDFHQHITRTHIITDDKLPSFYDQYEIGEDLLKILRSDFTEFLAKENYCFKKFIERSSEEFTETQKDDMFGDRIVKGINRILINRLAANNQHLQDIQVDLNPRHEAFWNVGGINIPKSKKKKFENIEFLKEFANDPVDRSMQFRGKPILTLRHRHPLRTVSDCAQLTSTDVQNFLIPFSRFDPATIGYSYEHRHATNIPGFWPGEEHEFALLAFQKQGFLVERTFDDQDNLDALKAHAILTAFSWLSALANYQGFTTFNDVTYSTVCQNVCTNGQKWSFFVYEMNTMLMILEHIYENPKRNICWAGPLQLKLYDEIDSNGNVTGLNDEVIKTLCKLYMNRPEERIEENMKPYLAEEQFIANYQDEDKRQWLEREYKHLMANKLLSNPGPEIHHWEKIYKIDHKKRQHEPLMRPFEIGQNMYSRRLNDRHPVYWPKKLRPHGNRKPKFYKDYFP